MTDSSDKSDVTATAEGASTAGEGLLPILDAAGADGRARLAKIAERGGLDPLDDGVGTPMAAVREILAAVRSEGNRAVVRYIKEFDGAKVAQSKLGVPAEALAEAWDGLAPEQRAALEAALANVRRYQEAIFAEALKMVAGFGRQLEMRLVPIRRIGIYAPGGRAAYPSTVLMTAVPARVAGVAEVVVVTPPDKKGNPHPSVLAACHLAGVDEVFRVGGAQAIGALAYGTDTIAPVDLIVGPGNQYVTLAKQLVFGRVGIDMLAGPTELVVIADETARADWVAADLLAQAEHDPLAACALLTTSRELAERVVVEVERQLADLPTAEICRQALAEYGVIALCGDIDEACAVATELAPEHLQVVARNPEVVGNKVPSAGATFLGPFTPEAVGDYIAGPSHVLPTGGTARFSSGLSVFDFLVRRHRVTYQREGLRNELPALVELARMEGLEAHARSAEARLAEGDS